MNTKNVLDYYTSKITDLTVALNNTRELANERGYDARVEHSENQELQKENEQLKCDLEETQRLKMQFFNDWGRVCGQTERLQEQINELQYEHKEAVANYLSAANTMVEMYKIVTKNVDGSSKQGILEDVEAKIEEYEDELEFLRYVWNHLGPTARVSSANEYQERMGRNAPEVGDWFPF